MCASAQLQTAINEPNPGFLSLSLRCHCQNGFQHRLAPIFSSSQAPSHSPPTRYVNKSLMTHHRAELDNKKKTFIQYAVRPPILPTFLAVVCIPSLFFCLSSDSLFIHKCGLAAIYKGTVNDPTTFPAPSKSHGSYHWSFERLLSAGLVPLTAAAFVTSGSSAPLLDGLLGVGLIVHSHIGVRLSLSSPYTHPSSC